MTRAPALSRVRSSDPIYGALIGLATLAILLQGLSAGMFSRYDGKRDDSKSWISAHNIGADVATLLVLVALIVVVVRMRSRRDLLAGTSVLLVLVVLEGILGRLVVDNGKDALTAVHVPLAMLIMGVAVWLPLRSRARRG